MPRAQGCAGAATPKRVTFDRSPPWLRPFGRTKTRPISLQAKLCFGESHQSHLAPEGFARVSRGYPHTSVASEGPHTAHSCAGCGRARSLALPFGSWLRLLCGVRLAYGAGTPTELNNTKKKTTVAVLGPVWRARATLAFACPVPHEDGRVQRYCCAGITAGYGQMGVSVLSLVTCFARAKKVTRRAGAGARSYARPEGARDL